MTKFIDEQLISKETLSKNFPAVNSNHSVRMFGDEEEDSTDLYSFTEVINEDTTDEYIEVIIHEFTSEEKYYLFGDSAGEPLRKYTRVQNDLKDFANANNIVAIYESYDTVPAFYNSYVNNYMDTAFPSGCDPGYDSASGGNFFALQPTWYYDSYDRKGSSTAGRTFPIMWGGWNNRISSFWDQNLYGIHLFYDKTFF